MMLARKSHCSSLSQACFRCAAVTRFEDFALASLAALVTREIMKSSSALARMVHILAPVQPRRGDG